jgi:alkylation response protein AidB-like acyl-CoA dehydrogenase
MYKSFSCLSRCQNLRLRKSIVGCIARSRVQARHYSRFQLGLEQLEIQQLVRRVAHEKVRPRAKDIDATAEYPQDMFELLRELGLFTLPFPEEYGGQASLLSAVVAIEELGIECYNTAYLLLVQWLPISALLAAGSESQKAMLLPDLAVGKTRAAFSTTEPQSGSDIRGIKTKARPMQKDGKDGYVLDGAKVWCTNAPVADFVIVACRLDDGKPASSKGPPPLNFFVVPKDTPGFQLGRHEEKLGGRGVPSSALFFDTCWIPQENMLGWTPEHGLNTEGFYKVMDAFNHSRPIIAARAVGLAQGALNKSIEFLGGRRAFGQTLTDFQGLRWMLADMEGTNRDKKLIKKRLSKHLAS